MKSTLFRMPRVNRELTPVEEAKEPALVVALADEGNLGQIVALPAPHNHIPQGRNWPLPNTAAVKQWFRDLVRTLQDRRRRTRASGHAEPSAGRKHHDFSPVESGRGPGSTFGVGHENGVVGRAPAQRPLCGSPV